MARWFPGLAALLVVPHVDAAPAPAPGLRAKEKLESLKKQFYRAWLRLAELPYDKRVATA